MNLYGLLSSTALPSSAQVASRLFTHLLPPCGSSSLLVPAVVSQKAAPRPKDSRGVLWGSQNATATEVPKGKTEPF